MARPHLPARGMHVGIGHRRELASALLADPSVVDFVEVVAESLRDPRIKREALAVRELWPVVPHGVKLSLGSAEGLDDDRAREFGRLARELRAPVVSEHVSFVRAGGREIGHLTELPLTREAIAVVARNVAALRRRLPDVPLLLENVARAFVWPDEAHEMDEGTFYAEVVDATGCDLLLDAGNLYANAVNAGLDPHALLATYPVDRVAMIHVAGGIVEHGFYFDTHAHPVPEPVFALVESILAQRPEAAVMLERDASFENVEAVLGEVKRLGGVARGGRDRDRDRDRSRPRSPNPESPSPNLDVSQAKLAEALTRRERSEDGAIERARGILVRKRADDALPLLPELALRISSADALRLGKIESTPRLPQMTAVADAMRIAEAAMAVPELAAAASRDAMLLRARFAGGPAQPAPRVLPWLARTDAAWAFKGFGRTAPVRVYSSGGPVR